MIILGKFQDLTGMKFGRLTVVRRGENNKNNKAQWWCLCDCQLELTENERKLKLVLASSLKSGATQSCGCLHHEMASKKNKKYNTYDLTGEYGVGYTHDGKEFYFDLEDYNLIKEHYWHINPYGYVATSKRVNSEQTIKMLFHRIIMNCEDQNIEIDHIHGINSRNDNRKSNLRIATVSQNAMNRKLSTTNTSGCTGVCPKDEKWRAYIYINGKAIELGLFDKKEDAIKIRKEAEEKYFGEWSYDNSQKHGINEN